MVRKNSLLGYEMWHMVAREPRSSNRGFLIGILHASHRSQAHTAASNPHNSIASQELSISFSIIGDMASFLRQIVH